MAKRTAVNVVNAVNNYIKKQYNYNLPAVTSQNFSDMAGELRTAPVAVQNDWLDTLINLVGLKIVKNKRQYESYFRKLHRNPIDTFDVQLLMVDLIKAKAFNPKADSDDFFEDEPPRVGVQYSNRVIKLKYPVSVNEESLYGAFISEGAFMDFLDSITIALYSSMEMGDVELTKELINQNIAEGNFRIVTCSKPVDKDTSLAFTQKLKKESADMAVEMGAESNLAGYNTFTPEGDGVIISTTEMSSVIETYSLPWAFDKDLLELRKEGQYIETKSDGFADGKVFAVYADRDAFEIREITGFPKITSQYFGNTLTQKRWLHYWGLYTISYFNNVVIFAAASDVGIASATIGPRDGSDAVNRGEKKEFYVASVTAEEGKLADKFGTYSLQLNTDSDTYIDPYTGVLYVGKSETGTSDGTNNVLRVIWTSHLDSSVEVLTYVKVNQ